MLDYIKLDLTNQVTRQFLEDRLRVHFILMARKKGPYLNHEPTAGWNGWIFRIDYEGRIFLEGSLHKWWNLMESGIAHNANTFDYESAVMAIQRLCEELGIDPMITGVEALEYGVNVTIGMPAKHIIQNALVTFKGKGFDSRMIKQGTKGLMAQFVLSDYYVKVYDKGTQYGLSREVLRFEIKTRRKAHLKMLKIHVLQDLMHYGQWQRMANDLYERFTKHTLIIDASHKSASKGEIKPTWRDIYGSPSYWESLAGKKNKKIRQAAKDNLKLIHDMTKDGIYRCKEHVTPLMAKELRRMLTRTSGKHAA